MASSGRFEAFFSRFTAIDSPKITRFTSECFVQAEGPHTWHRVPCVVTSPIHHPRHFMIVSHLRHNPRMVLYTTEIIRACRPENGSTAFRVVTVFGTNLSGEALHFVSDSYKAQSSIHRSQNEVTKGSGAFGRTNDIPVIRSAGIGGEVGLLISSLGGRSRKQ